MHMAKRSHTHVNRSRCPCQSSEDYGSTQINPACTKVISLQGVATGLCAEEEEEDCFLLLLLRRWRWLRHMYQRLLLLNTSMDHWKTEPMLPKRNVAKNSSDKSLAPTHPRHQTNKQTNKNNNNNNTSSCSSSSSSNSNFSETTTTRVTFLERLGYHLKPYVQE